MRNPEARKVCVLSRQEHKALLYGVRPDCKDHAHISKSEAADQIMCGDLEYVKHHTEAKTFAVRKKSKGEWKKAGGMTTVVGVQGFVWRQRLGAASMQLV